MLLIFRHEPRWTHEEPQRNANTAYLCATRYDGDNVIQQLNGAGATVADYTQGAGIDEPLALYSSASTAYYHADGLGSVTALTNGSGQLANSYVYDSFGNLTASTGTITNPFQYTAREFDSETGLYYYRARYYNPQVGRFLSEDPLGFSTEGNFYKYVGNRPNEAVDPSGLVTVTPLPAQNIHTLPDIDGSCVSPTNPTGVTAGGCNKVDYRLDWTGCSECDHTPKFTVTLTGSIYVAAGPFPYKGRNPRDRSIVNTATALAHEQRHTDDMVNGILPILQHAEHAYPSEAACEEAAEAAALAASPAWNRAAQQSQRRRH